MLLLLLSLDSDSLGDIIGCFASVRWISTDIDSMPVASEDDEDEDEEKSADCDDALSFF